MLRQTRLLLVAAFLTLCTLTLALGQEMRKDPSNKTPIITASVTSDGVHIAAPSAVVQLRLEVYDNAGQKLLDTEQSGGNVLDWHLQASTGERVADGTYLCVVTITTPSGQLSQKIGLVTVNAQSTTLRPAGVAELSPLQAQLVKPIEGEDEGLAVVPGSVVTNLVGSGTQDRMVKWADNSGTLGDTQVSESNGNLVVGNAAQKGSLQVYGTAGQDVFAGMGPDLSTGPAFNFGYAGTSFGRSAGFFNVRPDALAVAPNPSLRFMTNNIERMILTNTGNVGIGTTNPSAKLEVAGNLKLSGAGSSLIFPDGSSMTTAASGGAISGTNIVSAIDDPGTTGTINDNRLSSNVARLSNANTFGANQAVNGNVTATGTIAAGGRVESNSGGFKFPDGSVQTTAAGKTYTTFPFGSEVEIGKPIGEPGGGTVSILQLDLPAGGYMVTATVQFENRGLFNKRLVACQLINEATWFFRIEGSGGAMDQMPITMHTVINHQGGVVQVYCQAIDGGGRSNIFARARRLTAIRLGDVVTQP